MAASVDDSKIVVPFMPSLLHIALVKVSIPLYQFDYETLEMAVTEARYFDIKMSGMLSTDGSSIKFDEYSKENLVVTYNGALGTFLNIPRHLRKRVLETAGGMQNAVMEWRQDHKEILESKDEDCSFYLRSDGTMSPTKSEEYSFWGDDINSRELPSMLEPRDEISTFHWRCDGTIDTTKTAQELVLNNNINIRKRFEIACMYCMEKSVQTLWEEMETTGKTKNVETDDNPMIRFWVRWMREGSKVPWIQAVREYLEPPDFSRIARLSSFFPLLEPKDRQVFLDSFLTANLDDLRFCLYAMTKEEEEQILEKDIDLLIRLYLKWPLQSLFLETVEKVWNYMEENYFFHVLCFIENWKIKEKKKDFDYCRLFLGFWDRSPDRLRESKFGVLFSIKSVPEIRRKIQDDENRENSEEQYIRHQLKEKVNPEETRDSNLREGPNGIFYP